MDKNLIGIGRMAKINHTTIATLRLYDEEDILKPAYRDPSSGYRYYDIQQTARLDLIAYMKELGMSLEEIKSVFESKDTARIESILAKKDDMIHEQIRNLQLQYHAVERAIEAIERYRKSPTTGMITLEYIDRRYVWGMDCSRNFYEGSASDYEDCLIELKSALIDHDFTQVHTYNIGTSITKENFQMRNLLADKIFIFGDNTLYKIRNDMAVIESGMYTCIYADKYEDESEYAMKLQDYCEQKGYTIAGDYICEVLTEFNIFNEKKRNMYMRLQVPVTF